jgi:UDP-N-acetyl-2-amino-2-deoxyglucuronate dehydrogenase
MNKNKFGFGIVGCGLISAFHAKAIHHSQRMELVSVTDFIAEKANKTATEYECKVESFEEMLKNPEIDIINVLTPNAQHLELVLKAAEAKKHVLVEKPPEMVLEKVDQMIKAKNTHGVKIGVVLQCRFRKAIDAMKDAIDNSRFGKIVYASAYMKWFRSKDYYFLADWRHSKEQGAGVTIQQAFHYLDLLLYLTGDLKRINAKMTNLYHPEVKVEDTVQAFLEFTNGAVGSLEASTACYPGTDLRIEICGEDGLAVMKGEKIEEWKFKNELPIDEDIRKIGIQSTQTGATGPADLDFMEHENLFEDFIDAIINNREPRVSLEEGRRTLEAALNIYKSAEEEKWINV